MQIPKIGSSVPPMIQSHDDCALGYAVTGVEAATPVVRQRPGSISRLLACIVVTATLGACGLDINPGLSNGPGSLLVDPGMYSELHCKDLVAQWTSLRSREQDLRRLQDKANEGTGGAFIGALSYRTDYEVVLSDEKILLHEAAEQHCELSHSYESDQNIR